MAALSQNAKGSSRAHVIWFSPASLESAKPPNIAVSAIFCAAKRRLFKAVGRFFHAATPAPPLCPSTSVLRDFPRFGLKQTVAASQPAAATIGGLIFVGALSAFFDQDR
jgi:hypothetical protein